MNPELDTKAVTLNYNRMIEARSKAEPVLENIFESRMNRELDNFNEAKVEQSLGRIAVEVKA